MDAKALLQRQSWIVLNDEGLKEKFIFQKDGTLLVTRNGKVTRAKWEYLSVDTSIIVDMPNGETLMLNPVYCDDNVLALQVDGTQQFSLMLSQACIEKKLIEQIEEAKLYLTNKQEFEKLRQIIDSAMNCTCTHDPYTVADK